MVRRGHFTHEMMIVLITRTKDIPQLQNIISGIVTKLPKVVASCKAWCLLTNVVLGRTVKKLYVKHIFTTKF